MNKLTQSLSSGLFLSLAAALLLAAPLLERPARAGYEIESSPLEILSIDERGTPLEGVVYELYLGTKRQTLRIAGCPSQRGRSEKLLVMTRSCSTFSISNRSSNTSTR